MEKSIYIKIYNHTIQIKGYDTKVFRRYCDNNHYLIREALHDIGDNFKICKVATSDGPKIMIVCEDCFNVVKNKEYFIEEVSYEIQSIE